MNEIKGKSSQKNIVYILLSLLLILSILGIWKCQKNPSKESPTELAEEIDSLTTNPREKTNVTIEENDSSPTNNEQSNTGSQIKSTPLESEEDLVSKDYPNMEPEKLAEADVKEKSEKAEDILDEEPIQSTDIIYKVNKSIDKRSPASSSTRCNASSIFTVDQSEIQICVAFSPDGNNIAAGGLNDVVSIMNLEGEEISKLSGHRNSIISVEYSPDGRYILTGSGDHTAKIWDAKTGKEIRTLSGHKDDIFSVAYSPNGKFIATASLDHTCMIWDAISGTRLFYLRGHKAEVTEVAFSEDSKLLITGSSDETAKIWNVKSGKLLYSLEEHGGVSKGAFTANDNLILTAGGKKIRVWNAKTGKHMHTINGHRTDIMSIDISDDGEFVLSTSKGGVIRVWKIKGGKELCELRGHTTRVREAVFHPSQKDIIVSASNDHTIRLWKFATE